MVKGSEAISDFPRTSPIPEEKIKPDLKVVKDKPSEEEIIEEIKEEKIGKISPKVEKKVAKKIAACIAAGITVTTGGFIALGESGNLPKQVQEWYDPTSESIRKAFGIAEAEGITDVQSEAPFTGLEIEGLATVFQNGRWEYVDSGDGLVVGYWNEKEGRYEHTADILKGEWKGLFISQSIKEVNSSLKSSGEWTIENWNDRKIKIPLPFDITKGGVIEKVKALGQIITFSKPVDIIGIRDLPQETNVFSPFSPNVGGVSFGGFSVSPENLDFKPVSVDMQLNKGLLKLNFDFKNRQECLVPDVDYDNAKVVDGNIVYDNSNFTPKSVVLGVPILNIETEEIIPKSFLTKINPFLKNEYQILLSIYYGNRLSNFSFDNFFKDNKGRFIYINPNQNGIENQIEKQIIVEDNFDKEIIDSRQKEVELEGNKPPFINGLEFNEKDGKYIVEKDNNYGLEEGIEAGVFINGFVGLDSEIIKFLQNESNIRGEFKIPLPINIQEVEDVKLKVDFVNILIISFSGSAIVYSPIDGKCWHGFTTGSDNYKTLNFELGNNRELQIKSKEINYFFDNEIVEIGDLLVKIDKEVILDLNGLNEVKDISNLSNEEILEMGLDNILRLEGVPVFILPR